MRLIPLFWLIAIGVLVNVEISTGCRCFPTHPHRKYCNADFAIKAHIRSVKNIMLPGNLGVKERRYTVHVCRVFKGKIKTGRAFIYTSGSHAECGIKLPLRQTWLLTGSFSNKQYRINSCGWNAKWIDGVTRAQKIMLRKKTYENACKCGKTIVTCAMFACPRIPGCQWYSRTPEGSCQTKYAWCDDVGGVCKWRHRWYGWRKCKRNIKKSKKGK